MPESPRQAEHRLVCSASLYPASWPAEQGAGHVGGAYSAWLLILSILLLAVGYPSLLLIDNRAENFWTFFGCAAILIGYSLIAVSIFFRKD